MTTVAVLADPPRPGSVLTDLVESDLLTGEEAADLYAAMLQDVCGAVASSGGELLVNYRAPDDDEAAAEEAVRSVVAEALAEPDAVRYEVQVGSNRSARVGNTLTHLIETEGVQSAAVVDPRAPLLERRYVDSAAMKLRKSSVVLGPSTDGRVYYAGFTDPVDFEGSFTPPAVDTLTARARDAGFDVDFVEMLPIAARRSDLGTFVSLLDARDRAGKRVPPNTRSAVRKLGLHPVEDDGRVRVTRD